MRTHAHLRVHTRVHMHAGAAHRARRPSHRLALCLILCVTPLALGYIFGFFKHRIRYGTVPKNLKNQSSKQHDQNKQSLTFVFHTHEHTPHQHIAYTCLHACYRTPTYRQPHQHLHTVTHTKRKKNYAGSETPLPHINQGKGTTLVPVTI
jgi:hypothetical protein